MTVSAPSDQLNFVGQNLQGRSFRGQNLTGANFSGANLRSTDFSAALLVGANFQQAQLGLNRRWQLVMLGLIVLLSVLAGVGCGIAGVISLRLLHPNYIAKWSLLPGLATLVILPAFMASLLRWGFTSRLVTFSASVAGCLIINQAILWSSLGGTGLNMGQETAWRLAGAWAWALVGIVFGSLAAHAGQMLWQRRSRLLIATWSIGMGLALYASWELGKQAARMGARITRDLDGWPWMMSVALLLGALSTYIGWHVTQPVQTHQTTAEKSQFGIIERMAIWLCTIGGTKFQRADLTEANLSQLNLAQTNFTQATLTHTNLHLAGRANQAKLDGTILQHPAVRDLLTSHRGECRGYVGCNLQGAYLVNAALADADFTDANFQHADLRGAELDRANLTRTQMLGANLQATHLTAACIAAWNIDQTTQLEGIHCDFIYRLPDHQERLPSSGQFDAGEFTQLFRQTIDTVELIIRNGVDWPSLHQTIQQLQINQDHTALEVQSIEHKGDGLVVVKVAVPPETDKQNLYESFQATYAQTIAALEAKHHAELAAKDAQIDLYREHQQDLKQITHLLATATHDSRKNNAEQKPRKQNQSEHKCVILKINRGDFVHGFPVTLQIGREGEPATLEMTGHLPAAPYLERRYADWKQAYQTSYQANYRIHIPDTQITHISRRDFWGDSEQTAQDLVHDINQWLNHEAFRPIKERLLEQLNPSDLIRVIIQTDDGLLRHLPLQTWDWFDRYPHAEIALSTPDYQQIEQTAADPSTVKILAILGDDHAIDIEHDRALLNQLPQASVEFLVQPQRQALNDRLWEQNWDILFFAGHSRSQTTDGNQCSTFQINAEEHLSIDQLRHGLRKAIAHGLKLAIFNSCDGLGIAVNLADLHLPQMIVMREPVPDLVAQEFLKHFLADFASGISLYQGVRSAREKLQGLEDRFPCASWLPVIYQNPTAPTLQWNDLHDSSRD